MSVGAGDDEIYLEAAKRVFAGARYQAIDEEVKSLAESMVLLEQRSLQKLNQRLLEGGRKIWDTFVELNFARALLLQHNPDIPVSYEPDIGYLRPVDLKIELGAAVYWVQVKNLSLLERENRQFKIIQKIKNAAADIKVSRFFSISLASDFGESDVHKVMGFIVNKATEPQEGVEHWFPNRRKAKAKIEFWSTSNLQLDHLALGISGDLDIVEETGLASGQIGQSLRNAAGAFYWNIDSRTINLVAMDAQTHHDFDICNAIFGAEFQTCSNRGLFSHRENNGLFQQGEFSEKIAGVIDIRRKEETPISNCCFLLYLNEAYEYLVGDLHRLLLFDRIIHCYMFPSNTGNVELPKFGNSGSLNRP